MSPLFDLTSYSTTDLERIELGIQSGINECLRFMKENPTSTVMNDAYRTMGDFKYTLILARKEAAKRESEEWAKNAVNEIFNP